MALGCISKGSGPFHFTMYRAGNCLGDTASQTQLETRGQAMLDIAFVTFIVGFFLLAFGYVGVCERLR